MLLSEKSATFRDHALHHSASLNIGDPCRDPELAPADLRERSDTLADGRMGGVRETKPQPALAVRLVSRPFRSRIDGYARCLRRLRQSLRVDHVWELHPQEDAALRLMKLSRRTELLGKRLHERIELGSQSAHQSRKVTREMLVAELPQHHLLQCAGAGIGFEREHARENVPGRDDIANPQRRGDRFGEGADVNNSARFAHGVKRGGAAAIPDQIGVALVLENRNPMLLRDAQQLEPALFAHDGAGWILYGGDSVDVFGTDAPRMEMIECRRQGIDPQTLAIERNAYGLYTAPGQPRERAAVAFLLDQHRISRREQNAVDEIYGLQ